MNIWKRSLNQASNVLKKFIESSDQLENCQKWSDQMIAVLSRGGTVFTCGNGGSYCDALHFAEEMTGYFRSHRPPLAALTLGEASHITCVSNDLGFEEIFSRQLEALGKEGDMLVALSTSGQSQNVIRAVQTAQSQRIFTVGLLGKSGGELKNMVDLPIIVPSETSDRIQEVHIKLIHTVIETIERHFFPEHY